MDLLRSSSVACLPDCTLLSIRLPVHPFERFYHEKLWIMNSRVTVVMGLDLGMATLIVR